jgi:hypothetical protein
MFSIPSVRNAVLKYKCNPEFKLESTGKKEDDNTKIAELDQIKDIDNNNTLCALKMVFEQLNTSTTSFTDKEYASKFTNQKITNKLPVAYLIKMYLLGRQATNPSFPIDTKINSNQQDVDEFVRIIFNIIGDNEELKSSLDVFKWYRKTKLTCEDPAFKKDERTDEEAELTVQLDANSFMNEKNISYKNKINKAKATDGGISLQDLINYYSKASVPSMMMSKDPSKIPDYAKNPDGSIKPEA